MEILFNHLTILYILVALFVFLVIPEVDTQLDSLHSCSALHKTKLRTYTPAALGFVADLKHQTLLIKL